MGSAVVTVLGAGGNTFHQAIFVSFYAARFKIIHLALQRPRDGNGAGCLPAPQVYYFSVRVVVLALHGVPPLECFLALSRSAASTPSSWRILLHSRCVEFGWNTALQIHIISGDVMHVGFGLRSVDYGQFICRRPSSAGVWKSLGAGQRFDVDLCPNSQCLLTVPLAVICLSTSSGRVYAAE